MKQNRITRIMQMLLLVATATLTMSLSCTRDDDEPSTNGTSTSTETLIVGRWGLIGASSTVVYADGHTETADTTFANPNGMVFRFDPDGSMDMLENGVSLCDDVAYRYSINGGRLILSAYFVPVFEFQITSVTSDRLFLDFSNESNTLLSFLDTGNEEGDGERGRLKFMRM